MELLKLFKKDKINLLITAAVSLPLFSVGVLALQRLPSSHNLACSVGGNLTSLNLGFTAIFSILIGIASVGYIHLFKNRRIPTKSAGSGILSILLISLTSVCTICVFPTLSFFGLSIGLSIFSTYNLSFKLFALIMLLASIYFLELKLRKICIFNTCEI